jgi:hypothetical protein
MRVRITDPLSGSIDGIQLDQFTLGYVYDVGPALACYLMALGAAEPVLGETPVQVWPRGAAVISPSPEIPLGRSNVVHFPLANADERRRRPSRRKKHP